MTTGDKIKLFIPFILLFTLFLLSKILPSLWIGLAKGLALDLKTIFSGVSYGLSVHL